MISCSTVFSRRRLAGWRIGAHARRLVLDFGRGFASHVQVFVALQNRLLKAASP
jgi:hypothetical protein